MKSQHFIQFSKCHGYGNDFLIISNKNISNLDISKNLLSERLCDRNFSIGADGIIFWEPLHAKGHFSASIYNADGSKAEISGNGLRCLAAYLYHKKIISDKNLFFETDSGTKNLTLIEVKGYKYLIRTNLGRPIFEHDKIPFKDKNTPVPILKYPLTIKNYTFEATILSTGNPHCIVIVSDLTREFILKYGPYIETNKLFPERVNVEFITPISKNRIAAYFWERGVGHTMSSGTGSAAAAIAAILNGWCNEKVHVEMEGGIIKVDWIGQKDIIQDGTANMVFEGEISSDVIT